MRGVSNTAKKGLLLALAFFACILMRVEPGEPLRAIAKDYDVSYEAVRHVIRAACHG